MAFAVLAACSDAFLDAAFFATVVRVFVADFPVLALLARATFVAAGFPVVLEDFLRVFLDIRLPFVAFRSSTIGVLRVLLAAAGFAPAAGQV
ncbi:MAG: hypothetical protein CFE30_30920 [Bradyrhizobium sp. PARBB1]|nr:MAG: hypothetical protein CFE30_30920 [Bradyrhizobium sp. PARBB1]PSO28452.1 hypothetical protein C7G43_04680 [Bradyrhizobium sp. MOS004]HAQ78756.1 hypothetical protein [Bradyrhizobium sp.]HAR14523.1 hypothetical protein [Bradyrhizobium sp.]HAR26185.1 hypothetical protein [Bradyrhizobium sp.]